MADPVIALRTVEEDRPAITVRVNFGVFSGREATAAEIGELARRLAAETEEFSIVSEDRHEFSGAVEASVHQVRVEVAVPASLRQDELADRIVDVADEWARACIAERSVDVETV